MGLGLSHAMIYFPMYEYLKDYRKEIKGKELNISDIFFISSFSRGKVLLYFFWFMFILIQ